MRAQRRGGGLLLTLAMLLSGLGPSYVGAEDGVANLAARKARLRERTRAWLTARKKLFYPSGRRVRVSRKTFFKLYYDLHSPAWRARQGEPETLEAIYRAMDAGKGRPRAVTGSAVVGAELVTARLGIARYKMNGLATVREVRWVWAEDSASGKSKGKDDWYLYGGDVDGPWGAPSCDASPASRRALPKEAAVAIRKRLAALKLKHTVEMVAAAGTKELVVVLAMKGAQVQRVRADALRADAIAVLRALLSSQAGCSGLRLAFLADWMDKYGGEHRRAFLHACMDRATFDRIVFENLKPEQVLALFVTRSFEHEGLTVRTP